MGAGPYTTALDDPRRVASRLNLSAASGWGYAWVWSSTLASGAFLRTDSMPFLQEAMVL